MKRDFKGIWIPREIWLDRRLTAKDKILWALINDRNLILKNEAEKEAKKNGFGKSSFEKSLHTLILYKLIDKTIDRKDPKHPRTILCTLGGVI